MSRLPVAGSVRTGTGTTGTTGTGTGIGRIDTRILAAVVDHTNAHNRALQQHDMWRAREKEVAVEARIRNGRSDATTTSAPVPPAAQPATVESGSTGVDVMDEFRALVGTTPVSIDWAAARRASQLARIDSKRRNAADPNSDRWGHIDIDQQKDHQTRNTLGTNGVPIRPPTKTTIDDMWERNTPKQADDSSSHRGKERKDKKKHKKRRRSRSPSLSTSSSASSSDSSSSITSDSDSSTRHRSRSKRSKSSNSTKSDRRRRSRSRERSKEKCRTSKHKSYSRRSRSVAHQRDESESESDSNRASKKSHKRSKRRSRSKSR